MPIEPTSRSKKIALLLLEDFSMMAFASFIEPLRSLNRTLNQTCYEWVFVSEDGNPVPSSSGATIQVHHGLEELEDCNTVCVVSGLNATYHANEPVLNWLRKQAVTGKHVGAISIGTYLLAKAGLLDGKRATSHWESLDSLKETFPEVDFTDSLYEIDGKRFTCAGGTAVIDLVLHWVGAEYGTQAKTAVSDQFLHGLVRESQTPQKADIVGRYGVHNEKLLSVINLMEDNLEEPLSRSELADKVAITIRQLERLFSKHLKESPSHFYLRLRLNRARDLLRQTAMPISEIAIACGFVNFSHFARSYRTYFSCAPRDERAPEKTS